MAKYNLTQDQTRILTSWLYEPGGYLEAAVDALGVSARQARVLDLLLDVTAWIRTSAKGPDTLQSDWDECGMWWWVRANDGVNITPATRPIEAPTWVAILHATEESINAGFGRADAAERNKTTVPIYDESGAQAAPMPAGSHLTHQGNMVTKVLGVLE